MMKEKFNFRLLHKEDLNDVVNLVRTTFDANYLIPSIYRSKGVQNFLSAEIDSPLSPYIYFALTIEFKLIGYAEFKITKNQTESYLNIIAVDNKYKNRGAGTHLYSRCVAFLKDLGIKKIFLNVFGSNNIALKWYLKMGYEINKELYMYKIVPSHKNLNAKIFILNYPQFLSSLNQYGFSNLEVIYLNQKITFGYIDQDIIIKNRYTKTLDIIIKTLLDNLDFNNAYLLGDLNDHSNLKLIDKFLSLELNL